MAKSCRFCLAPLYHSLTSTFPPSLTIKLSREPIILREIMPAFPSGPFFHFWDKKVGVCVRALIFFALPGWKMVLTSTTFVRYTKPKAGGDGERYTCMHTQLIRSSEQRDLYVSSSSCHWIKSRPWRVLLVDDSMGILTILASIEMIITLQST